MPLQTAALCDLTNSLDIIVFKTDKNLGPAVVERSVYIRRALDDHLLDTNTYRYLSEQQAVRRTSTVRKIIENFARDNFPAKGWEQKFLLRSLTAVTDPFAYFYITAKVHKTPWKTRPIVSVSGSLLHGLGQWVDKQLQKLVYNLPFALTGSDQLHQQLSEYDDLPPDARIFTMDAVSMYTNIETPHAMKVISDLLGTPMGLEVCKKLFINHAATLKGLKIIMAHNVFRFGDTHWVQLAGTAMGTPPAPAYATLYFYCHETKFVPKYTDNLLFYRRFIDDGIGIWAPDPDKSRDDQLWKEFQHDVNDFGSLKWEFLDRTPLVDFLDLTITLTGMGKVATCLYEKAMNLYLYLPPHSAHPP